MSNTTRDMQHLNVFSFNELCVDENGIIRWLDDNTVCWFFNHEVVGVTVNSLEDAIIRWTARNLDKFIYSPKKTFRKIHNRADRRSSKVLLMNALYAGIEDDVSVNDMQTPLPYWD